jgi:hypothetical protein
MVLYNLVRFLFILGIGFAGVGIMFSSALLGKPIEEKAIFATIGLFVTSIAFLFLYLNKDVLSMFDY